MAIYDNIMKNSQMTLKQRTLQRQAKITPTWESMNDKDRNDIITPEGWRDVTTAKRPIPKYDPALRDNLPEYLKNWNK
jgi:hypothetical protein